MEVGGDAQTLLDGFARTGGRARHGRRNGALGCSRSSDQRGERCEVVTTVSSNRQCGTWPHARPSSPAFVAAAGLTDRARDQRSALHPVGSTSRAGRAWRESRLPDRVGLRACGGPQLQKSVLSSEQSRPDIARKRASWKKHQASVDPRRLIFIDETWPKTNMAPLRGWAPRGQRLDAKVSYGHWKTMTFLAALRHDRTDAPCVFDGLINAEKLPGLCHPQTRADLEAPGCRHPRQPGQSQGAQGPRRNPQASGSCSCRPTAPI